MRTITCLILLSLLAHAWGADPAGEARIAQVNIGELEADLRDVVLAKPENAALKKDLAAAEILDEQRNKSIQEAAAAGKDLTVAMKAVPGSDGKATERLERLMRAEVLRFVVKKYGKRYVAVFNSNYLDSALYIDGDIIDLTQSIRQALQLNEF